jgi:hypothetical protein
VLQGFAVRDTSTGVELDRPAERMYDRRRPGEGQHGFAKKKPRCAMATGLEVCQPKQPGLGCLRVIMVAGAAAKVNDRETTGRPTLEQRLFVAP